MVKPFLLRAGGPTYKSTASLQIKCDVNVYDFHGYPHGMAGGSPHGDPPAWEACLTDSVGSLTVPKLIKATALIRCDSHIVCNGGRHKCGYQVLIVT